MTRAKARAYDAVLLQFDSLTLGIYDNRKKLEQVLDKFVRGIGGNGTGHKQIESSNRKEKHVYQN